MFLLLAALLASPAQAASDYLLVAKDGVDAQRFDNLNVAHGTDLLSLYNSSWGASINPNAFNILARVNDDRITFIRPYNTTGAVTIGTDNWVIAVNGVKLPLLGVDRYAVGDELRVRHTSVCRGTGAVPSIVFHDLGATSTNFDAILDGIESDGYTTITTQQLRDYMNGEGDPLPAKPILLTFDDGYDNHFSFGAQSLHDHGMTGVFFIIGNRPGLNATWATWSEIATGYSTYPDAVEIGCHSQAAHSMVGSDGLYMTWDEATRINDLETCADTLESHLGATSNTIAWPFGQYDEQLVVDAKNAGFDLVMTTQIGLNHPKNGDGKGHIRRNGVNGAGGAGTWDAADAEISRWFICDNE